VIVYPFRYLWWLVSSVRRSIGRPPEFVVFVLEENLPALPDPPRPFWQRFAGRPRLSVKELGERFDAIARDSRVKGVVLHLRPVGMPMATLQDLRELVAKLRKSGKRVVAWAPFYNTGAYYLPEKDATFAIMVNSDIAIDGVNPVPALFKALAKVVTPENVPE